MNENPVDLYTSLRTENTVDYETVIQALKNFDINLEQMKKEVKFLDFDLSRHKEKYKKSFFGENESVSYKFVFVTYNMAFLVKLLTFQYDNKSEILKLDIQPETNNVKKELEYCCNTLKRRRNLNLMFTTLITFARFIESRRLICDLILKKNRNIKIEQNEDGGIIIIYSDEIRNIKVGIFWSIQCSSMLEVKDVVEVYYRVVELQSKRDIIDKLEMLTNPCLDFTKKYHLWKGLIDDLSEKSLIVVINKMQDAFTEKIPTKAEEKLNVLLSKHQKSPEKSLVIMIDKMKNTSKAETVTSNYQITQDPTETVTLMCSDSEDCAEKSLIVMIDKMPTISKDRSITSKRQISHKKHDSDLIVMSSDSEDSQKKSLVVVIDKMPNYSEATGCQENKDKEAVGVTILSSDSEDDSEKGRPRRNIYKGVQASTTVINIPDSHDLLEITESYNKFPTTSANSFYKKSRKKKAYNLPINLSDSEDIQCSASAVIKSQKFKKADTVDVLTSDSDNEVSTKKRACAAVRFTCKDTPKVSSDSSDLEEPPEKLRKLKERDLSSLTNILKTKKTEGVFRDCSELGNLSGISTISTELENERKTFHANTLKRKKDGDEDKATDSSDTESLSTKFRTVLTQFFKGTIGVKSNKNKNRNETLEGRLTCDNNIPHSDSDVPATDLQVKNRRRDVRDENTELLKTKCTTVLSRLPITSHKSSHLKSELEQPVVRLSLSPKRRKTNDDLEITSVTYVVPE